VYARDDEASLLRRFVDFPLVAMVVAFAAVMVPAGLVAGLAEHVLPPGANAMALGNLAVAGVMLASYKLVARHIGERRHDDLSGPGAVAQLAAGVALGALLLALIVGIAAALGVYQVVGSGDAANSGVAIINQGIVPAVAEEILYRAILFRWVEELAGSWIALAVSSAAFGLSHMWNPDSDAISTIGIMLEGGVLLGAAYMLTRRLWFPMGIHAAWNLTQGEVFDVPVSGNEADGLLDAKLHGPALLTGGGFGLEASVIAIAVGTAAGLVLLWLAARWGQVVPLRPKPDRSMAGPRPH
jgi:membrane protease YdiL (CAAX protease family)